MSLEVDGIFLLAVVLSPLGRVERDQREVP